MKKESNDCIYPGGFTPLLREEEVREELKRMCKGESPFPPVNVTELSNSFKVEVAIPGVKRENFLVYADDNILSVCVFNKQAPHHTEEAFKMHEFNYDCFERHITLPKNAEAEFVSAVYRSGILSMHIPKSDHPSKNQHTRIVVY